MPLIGAANWIGRLAGNDVVLDDADVSRHHAVVSDTVSVALADGDRIGICRHEFVFTFEPADV